MGFSVALTPFNIFMAVCGVMVGMLIGALPGVGPPSGVAMLLPLTFGMDPTSGIIMLAALYAGTMYGGTITAVLINTPGESASVVTCLDGYQMALKGRAGAALGIAAFGSFIAGTIGVVLLMLVSPLLARWALSFGPPETFALMLLGLTTVTLLAGEDPLKGYISMVVGLMLAMVGYDIISGDARYGFGIPEMMDGMDFLPVAMQRTKNQNSMMGLLFIDLDGFKNVNDTLGHSAGDELLQAAAQRLKSVLCPTDNVVRFGGDEFIVILAPVADAAGAARVAARVAVAFLQPFDLSRGRHTVSTSRSMPRTKIE